ncbi:MAG TPA: mechanosensitive ion channel [Candidatus Hydrogenedentes bacterium]|nr:mechanosensitive ion channel [Candidatus Hydrogenedentota bacterium]
MGKFETGSRRAIRAIAKWPPIIFGLIFCLGLMVFVRDAEGADGETPSTVETPSVSVSLTKEQALERIQALRNDLAAIPAAADETSPDARRKAALQRLIALLETYSGNLSKLEEFPKQQERLGEREEMADKELTALASNPGPSPPKSPTKEDFEELSLGVTQQRDGVEVLRKAIADAHTRLEESAVRISEARKQEEDADKAIAQFSQETPSLQEAGSQELLNINLEVSRIDKQVALQTIKILEAQTAFDKKTEPILRKEMEAADIKLKRLEEEFELYNEALAGKLNAEQQELQQDLEAKEQMAAEAGSPVERFIKQAEADLAASKKNKSEVEGFLISLKKDVSEQEKRLAAEKAELDSLHNLLVSSGAAPEMTDRLRQILDLFKSRRKVIGRLLQSDLTETVGRYRSRRFEIENTLLDFTERWNKDRDAALAGLSESAQKSIVEKSDPLYSEYRTALREEKSLLTEAIALGQQMQDLMLSRLDNLNTAERFVKARSFWLRDGKPISEVITRQLWQETTGLKALWQKGISADTRAAIYQAVYGIWGILYLVMLVLVLPLLLAYLLRLLRNAGRKISSEPASYSQAFREALLASVLNIIGAAVLPLYLFLTARLSAAMGLPAGLEAVLRELLTGAAVFLFGWLLLRAFLAENGVARVQFHLPDDAAVVLYRSLRLLLSAYILFFVPQTILAQPPFEFEATPRILYTFFEMAAAMAAARLIRRRSLFPKHVLSALGNITLQRLWPLLRFFTLIALCAVVVLDVAGYRTAALAIFQSVMMSLGMLLLIIPAYLGAMASLRSMGQFYWGKHWVELDSEEEIPVDGHAAEQQMEGFVRVLFVLLTVFVLAMAWGIDDQALKTLEEVHIYSLHGAGDVPEFITAADVLRFILYMGIMVWLLRHLPGIYEFAIFPRVNLDEGAKYAILTISRYGIFTIGIIMALSQVHLDLGRLGWLIAAIGVGLGFGLQEIVSNFFSGIILLVERPIRINDIVTIGNVTGTVRRINIRATTILNFDSQEVLLPNKDLVTQSVTNWTRGDTVNRLVIEIGVAYGSDLDKVTNLLMGIATSDPDVLDDPKPSVTFTRHGDSALEFVVRVFIPSPSFLLVVRDRLNRTINREFQAHGIEIPFPQRDIHIRSTS